MQDPTTIKPASDSYSEKMRSLYGEDSTRGVMSRFIEAVTWRQGSGVEP